MCERLDQVLTNYQWIELYPIANVKTSQSYDLTTQRCYQTRTMSGVRASRIHLN